jgi:restriction system protein
MERAEMQPSGQQPVFDNRVTWAVSYMKHAGLLEHTRRGVFRITERGVQVLRQHPARIDVKFLAQFPGFNEFRSGTRKQRNGHTVPEAIDLDAQQTPEERLEDGYQRIRLELAQELIARIMGFLPASSSDWSLNCL